VMLKRHPRALGKSRAGRGERNCALCPLHQHCADSLLQSLNLPGKRWLRNAQPQRGLPEMEVFGQHCKVPKLPECRVTGLGHQSESLPSAYAKMFTYIHTKKLSIDAR